MNVTRSGGRYARFLIRDLVWSFAVIDTCCYEDKWIWIRDIDQIYPSNGYTSAFFFLWRQNFWKAATKDYVLECFIKNIVTRDSVWSRDNWIYYTDIVSNLFFFLFLNFENRLLYERLRIRTFYKDRGHDYRKGRMENSVREKRNMGYKPWSGWHRAIFQGT